MTRLLLVALAVAGVLVAACGQPGARSSGDLAVQIKGAGNGYLNVETAANAECVANARTSGGTQPMRDAPVRADGLGNASWSYTAMETQSEAEVTYTVTCRSGTLSGEATSGAVVIGPNASTRVSGDGPEVTVTASRYGSVALKTASGATCSVDVKVRSGDFGEAPPTSLTEKTAGADGVVAWTYPAPRIPSGKGEHRVLCKAAAGSRQLSTPYEVTARTLGPAGLTVHVTTAQPARETFREEPSLVPLRDNVLAKIAATLPTEWKNATRGLGSLEVTETTPDIAVFIVAAKGTSVHRRSLVDQSEDIVIYVSDESGVRSVENNVAVVLHELGHIWCCNGSGTTDGHWTTAEVSPGLTGVDKYGLMNHPVNCTIFASFTSCPNRFSDRELLTMGFTALPPPPPDACVVQKRALQGQVATLQSQLRDLEAAVAKANQTILSLEDRIRSIEKQYPNGIPPSQYDSYQALIRDHNALVLENRTRVNTYNATLAQANALVGQVNALPCDAL